MFLRRAGTSERVVNYDDDAFPSSLTLLELQPRFGDKHSQIEWFVPERGLRYY